MRGAEIIARVFHVAENTCARAIRSARLLYIVLIVGHCDKVMPEHSTNGDTHRVNRDNDILMRYYGAACLQESDNSRRRWRKPREKREYYFILVFPLSGLDPRP